jgi:molecular chaperone DnaK
MIYATEKSLKDLGGKVSGADKQKIEDAAAALKQALQGDDVKLIKQRTEELKQASYKIAEEMYKHQGAAGGGAGPTGGDAGSTGSSGGSSGATNAKGTADDVDYEVVDDEKK